jgi:hypothetical protein
MPARPPAPHGRMSREALCSSLTDAPAQQGAGTERRPVGPGSSAHAGSYDFSEAAEQLRSPAAVEPTRVEPEIRSRSARRDCP